jgi:YHS domain-containing protein
MGAPVRTDAAGRPVYLCCAGCEEKFADRPDYYFARLQTVADDGVLAVPESAVIDTGTQKIAYVEREPGLFEGVVVTLGPLADGYYAVIDGLLPGDRVAAAGAFLVDAETRLNPAAGSTYFGASGAPSIGAPASSTRSTNEDAPHEPMAKSIGPSSEDRENIAKLPEADRKIADMQRLCPITDNPLGSMGVPYKMVVDGKSLFLCCEGCKGKVDEDPAAALRKIQESAAPQR